MSNKVILLTVLATVLGCAAQTKESPSQSNGFIKDERPLATTLVYECPGYEFVTRLGPGEMALWYEDNYVILSQVRSASGAQYEEGDIIFWNKGEESRLSVGERTYTNCVVVPKRGPWEDARRRGVDFRAFGQEPGWELEIQEGRHLLFVGDYGMNRVMLSDPGVIQEGQMKVYDGAESGYQLRIEIVDEICNDTMRGDSFPSRVSVFSNGKRFRGCGRSLDSPWE